MKNKKKIISVLGVTTLGSVVTIGAVAQACANGDNGSIPSIEIDQIFIQELFSDLDGYTASDGELTNNQASIVNAIYSAANTLEIGMVNADNSPDSTWNSLVNGSTLNFAFGNDTPVVQLNSNGFYEATIPILTATLGHVATASTPAYEGLELEITGSNVIIVLSLNNRVVSNTLIGDDQITRVSPGFVYSAGDFETVYNQVNQGVVNTNNTAIDFNTFVVGDSVSTANLSAYSFVNSVSNSAGVESAFQAGAVSTNDFGVILVSNTDSGTYTFDSNVNGPDFFAGSFQSGWSTDASNITADNISYFTGQSLNRGGAINFYGTQQNPIFLSAITADQETYGQSQLEALVPLFNGTANGGTTGINFTDYPSAAIYQQFINAANIVTSAGETITRLDWDGSAISQINISNNIYVAMFPQTILTADANGTTVTYTGTMQLTATLDSSTQRLSIATNGISGLFRQ